MNRLLTITALTLLAALAPAAPVPRDADKPILYHPVQVGARWTYQTDSGERVLTVTRVEARGGTKVVHVGHVEAGGKVTPFVVMEVSGRGLVQTHTGGHQFDRAMTRFLQPAGPGERWGYHIFFGQKDEQVGTCTRGPVEQVVVPAGTFLAVRVDCAYTFFGAARSAAFWYAADVGEVKMEADGNTRVLTSFTPGKG
jgi:hypothetical protein